MLLFFIMKDISIDKLDYTIGGIYGSSGSYLISSLSENFDNIILLLNNNNEAQNFKDELSLFIKDKKEISLYLDIECFPYENVIIDNNIISERLKTYKRLINNKRNIIITTYSALSKRTIPKSKLYNFYRTIEKEHTYSKILQDLKFLCYERTDRVINRGEYAIKGSIIDVFSLVESNPMRISFDGDSIEFIKEFDPETQKTIEKISSFILSATNEIILDESTITTYKMNCKNFFDDEYVSDVEYQKITEGLMTSSIHNIMPALCDNMSHILDLLPKSNNAILALKNPNDEIKLINDRFSEYYLKHNEEKYLLDPKKLIIDNDEYNKHKKHFKNITLSLYKVNDDYKSSNLSIKKLPSLLINNTYKDPYKPLIDHLTISSMQNIFCIDRQSLRIELTEMLDRNQLRYITTNNLSDLNNIKSKIIICTKNLDEGFIDHSSKKCFIGARDIFGNRSLKSPKKSNKNLITNYIDDISSIEVDLPIVHDEYGVGRYKGLINMDIEGIQTELVKLEYANQDILYIPVTSINLIKKYTGHTGLNVPLHNLGTDHWIKIKNKAKRKINDIAVELLEIESRRFSSKGYCFLKDDDEYNKFKDDFPYSETTDQHNAIIDVLDDMQSNKLMDRLICGDVGFGKTEIIMRAAFLAALNNTQTMILAPTTILVEQHYQSFIKRFSHTAVNIGKLSRLQSSKEKNQTKENLKNGKIDIIIGTHSLLSKNIIFNNLRLLVIDEEHKFGVVAKEKIKKIKNNIDVLTLTATPIPRTLNSALSQIKDLSIIETPPQNRKVIVTRIIQWDKELIMDAINREIKRGGQIYYVHNEISTMNDESSKIMNLFKDINVGIIHGQLDSNIIEKEMNKFLNKEYDLIICTSIIESGLDIPNVNTIIINNCNKFGLSQLHQIRGRVGRTNRQAYAYLIIPNKSSLTNDAKKRLEAIDAVDSLGGGLELATHDLEIRGAGEILGEEQSGQIYEIGYAMFTDMLNKSVEILKSNDATNTYELLDVEVDISCLITQDYINDIVTRLKYYKDISSSKTIEDNQNIKDEMIDIYGPMPDYVENLFHVSNLKILIKGKNVKLIKLLGDTVRIEFIDPNIINIDIIMNNISNDNLTITKENTIKYILSSESFDNKCKEIIEVIELIG